MVFTLEEISLKLDIYNNNICDNLFNCAKDDKYCKSMISKLVFYDRDQILQMHADSLMNRDFKYDVSILQVVPFLGKNEKVAKIVPLEGHWIAVFFLDKKSKEVIKDKVMYISSEGDGYFSSNVEYALNGKVPEDIYAKFIKQNPNGLLFLDRIFKEDDYGAIRKMLYDVARAEITKLFANILDKDDITLEDIYPTIIHGFRNKDNTEEYEKSSILEFIYSQTVAEQIIKFDKKYNEFHSESQPAEQE